jgi:hypothetical protein
VDKQTALDQHRAIFRATIDYLLEKAASRVIVDQDDIVARQYEKMQQKAEKHYRNGKLELLQRVMREMGALLPLLQEDSYITFMKERTGYDVEVLKQILPNHKSKGVFIDEKNINYKKLAEKYSPDNKRKIIVTEIAPMPEQVVTNVDIHFGRAGASVYTVEGAGLDINVYWKDNNTVLIETRKDYVATSKHAEQYQCLDDIVKVEYVLH